MGVLSKPLRVLAVDHEGGHGGSSRSLYFAIANMDRRDLDIEVWCRRDSPLVTAYAALGVRCRVVGDIPLFRAQPTLRYTLRVLTEAMLLLVRRRQRLLTTIKDAGAFDVVHFNYESLFLFARWLRGKSKAAFVMHMRNCPPLSAWAAAQARMLSRIVDRFVFISDNERDVFARLGGDTLRGTVILNAAPPPVSTTPHPEVPRDGRLNVAILANGHFDRGLDRTVAIARELVRRGARERFRFVVGGDATLSPYDPPPLGTLARAGRSLSDYAADAGVGDMILFLGHVSRPESVLAAADMTARLTRRNDPWGRDVIESLAAGLPMAATGIWDGFIKDGISGWLLGEFDAATCAERLIEAESDRAALQRMGEAGRAHVSRICNGTDRAAELAAVWREAAAQRDMARNLELGAGGLEPARQ